MADTVQKKHSEPDGFYRAFEEEFRGSRELIRSRLRIYLPFIEPLKSIHSCAKAVDLGCGRGEWLELLTETGFEAQGVDLDESMLAACHERGLQVSNGDAIDFLRALPDASQHVVSGFHIAEHLPFSELRILVEEALRVLMPAGLLILETPNPENLKVAGTTFYLDPTHQRPLPPGLLSFLPQYSGFARVKIVRLQERPELRRSINASLDDVISGVSPDYAIVAQKAGDDAHMSLVTAAFNAEYGLTLNELIGRFDIHVAENDQQIIEQQEQLAEHADQMIRQQEQLAEYTDQMIRQQEQLAEHADQMIRQQEQLAEHADQMIRQQEQLAEHAETTKQISKALQHLRTILERDLASARANLEAREDEINRLRKHIAQDDALKRQLAAVYRSTSWQITAPLRSIRRSAGWFIRGTAAWLLVKPGSRPHRVATAVRFFLAGQQPSISQPQSDTSDQKKAHSQNVQPLSVKQPSAADPNDSAVVDPNPIMLDQLSTSDEPEAVRRIYQQLTSERKQILRRR